MAYPPKGTLGRSIAGALKTVLVTRGPITSTADIEATTNLICKELHAWENNSKITDDVTIIEDRLDLEAVVNNQNTQEIVAGKYLLNGRVYLYPKLYDYKMGKTQ